MSPALHLPCWAPLLNRIGAVLCDEKCLPVVVEYLRLTQQTFVSAPFWQTQWIAHQEKYAKPVEAAPKDNAAGKKECQIYRPPVKTMERGSATRWDSRYDEAVHQQAFSCTSMIPLALGPNRKRDGPSTHRLQL